jgi:hypothetical protein
MTRRKRKLSSQFVMDPDSEAISVDLSRNHANACMHGRSPCYLSCGVRRIKVQGYWRWVVIPIEERRAMLKAAEEAQAEKEEQAVPLKPDPGTRS